MAHLHKKRFLKGVLWLNYPLSSRAPQPPGEWGPNRSPTSSAAPGRKQGSVTVSRDRKNGFLATEKPPLVPSRRSRCGFHSGPGTGLSTAARRPEMALAAGNQLCVGAEDRSEGHSYVGNGDLQLPRHRKRELRSCPERLLRLCSRTAARAGRDNCPCLRRRWCKAGPAEICAAAPAEVPQVSLPTPWGADTLGRGPSPSARAGGAAT